VVLIIHIEDLRRKRAGGNAGNGDEKLGQRKRRPAGEYSQAGDSLVTDEIRYMIRFQRIPLPPEDVNPLGQHSGLPQLL
jgi:hypothetical protein